MANGTIKGIKSTQFTDVVEVTTSNGNSIGFTGSKTRIQNIPEGIFAVIPRYCLYENNYAVLGIANCTSFSTSAISFTVNGVKSGTYTIIYDVLSC